MNKYFLHPKKLLAPLNIELKSPPPEPPLSDVPKLMNFDPPCS